MKEISEAEVILGIKREFFTHNYYWNFREKYLYLYLLHQSTLCKEQFEINIKRISLDLGWSEKTIRKCLKNLDTSISVIHSCKNGKVLVFLNSEVRNLTKRKYKNFK